ALVRYPPARCPRDEQAAAPRDRSGRSELVRQNLPRVRVVFRGEPPRQPDSPFDDLWASVPAALGREIVRDPDGSSTAWARGEPRSSPLRPPPRRRIGSLRRADPRKSGGQSILPRRIRAKCVST